MKKPHSSKLQSCPGCHLTPVGVLNCLFDFDPCNDVDVHVHNGSRSVCIKETRKRRVEVTSFPSLSAERERERERERESHYVHSASLAYEDGIVFMSEPSAARQ